MILAYIIIAIASVSLAVLLLLPLIGAGAATLFWWRGRRAWAALVMLGLTGLWVFVLSTAVVQKRSYCTQIVSRLLTATNLAQHEQYYGEKISHIAIHPHLCTEKVCAELAISLQRPVRRAALSDAETRGTFSAFPTVHDAAGDLSFLDVVNVADQTGPSSSSHELVVMNSRVTGGIAAWIDSAMWLHRLPGLLWLRDCVAEN